MPVISVNRIACLHLLQIAILGKDHHKIVVAELIGQEIISMITQRVL